MSTVKEHDPKTAAPPPLHGSKEVAVKDAPKTPEEKKAEDDEKKTEATRAEYEGKIKSVMDSKPQPKDPPTTTPTVGINAVVTTADRNIKGQQAIIAPTIASPSVDPKAMAEYDKKVADLWADVEKLRVEKGADSPEFLEAHRIMAVEFR